MKKPHLLYIVSLLLPSLLLLNSLAQDFTTQWHLPEDAKARLGRGKLINIKLSPDSARVVASTSIGIWIYDAQTGEVVSLFTESQIDEKDGFLSKTPPEALTFSPDASIVATAHGNSIYVWDTFTGNAFAMLNEHPDSINAIALSPDGRKLATAGGDWVVRLWEVGTGKYITGLMGHPSAVNAVAFSPDGKILAGRGGVTLLSNIVKFWQTDTGDQLFTLEGHTGVVNEYTFSPDSKIFVSGSEDGAIVLWDTKTGESLSNLTGHTKSISALAFSADSKTLASGAGNGIHLWEVNTGNPISNFDAVEDIKALAFTPDGKTLVSGSETGLIQIWKSDPDYQIQTTLKGHQDAVGVLMFSPDGKTLASGSYDGTILLWDWKTLK